ncbi:ubiquitin carboxyl-terminal hydrolase 10-B-like [Stegodyphus dumicola]|uniref:ubiquitin carboxyl-terminal hydrolase 10-B-like n=1 Tax=Stegodyphus dumicola TaxID=202533 RepID=UPI0015AE9821|nr:ubiquitin carboxyl-terminal hydrolase 10-B-like [Stegodyphus dumicola]
MEGGLFFLNLDGLDDNQIKQLNDILHSSNYNSEIEFPWDNNPEEKHVTKGGSSLNVHAPVFETYVSKVNNHEVGEPCHSSTVPFSNGSSQVLNSVPHKNSEYDYPINSGKKILQQENLSYVNGQLAHQTAKAFDTCNAYSEVSETAYCDAFPSRSLNAQVHTPAASFKLNPTVSCFVPQNIKGFVQKSPSSVSNELQTTVIETHQNNEAGMVYEKAECLDKQNSTTGRDIITQVVNGSDQKLEHENVTCGKSNIQSDKMDGTAHANKNRVSLSVPVRRSWADVVSSGQRVAGKVPLTKPLENGNKTQNVQKDQEIENLSIEEDKMSLSLGKHLHYLILDFQPVLLQPRGLINRRNWCYINATLQALLACPPFFTLLRNLPLGPGVERGKSSTPVIDSMVKVAYEFSQYQSPQEELQLGTPFQPDFMYDMLRDLKSDCLKGQQEDAEEFLSFILNGMHEEMVKIIKNYERKNHIELCNDNDIRENGDVSEGEEEWQVIGSKHKGMVTRKVAEHKTPISDLLGGQIKSFLTTSGNKTSASIQPFFTLQLDIQSENVSSVSEALKEMTVKEPIQGYTCAKTKQEVEAYSHISLQKLPPILILHLKRFVYNKNGGCKKVMKKTDYPIQLELSKDLFSPDVKKNQRLRLYKLFAVMYHDGEEAVKGHYISDVYNHGCKTWIRCDDRSLSAVTEAQVLSHSPPRVPYLLFYQES